MLFHELSDYTIKGFLRVDGITMSSIVGIEQLSKKCERVWCTILIGPPNDHCASEGRHHVVHDAKKRFQLLHAGLVWDRKRGSLLTHESRLLVFPVFVDHWDQGSVVLLLL